MSYSDFAVVYDCLQSDVDYKARAEYLLGLFKRYDRQPTLLLDMACGTGGFSLCFADKGIDVIGVDPSAEMLQIAKNKAEKQQKELLLLCQSAAELDLYGTVDGAVCCLDSINHIIDEDELQESFDKISLFLEPGRLFIFDVNTEYKHREILSGNTFVYDTDEVYCVWSNSPCDDEGIVDIHLDFFQKQSNGSYVKTSEEFSERAYKEETLEKMLQKAGLEVLVVLGDMTERKAECTDERIIFVTRKR